MRSRYTAYCTPRCHVTELLAFRPVHVERRGSLAPAIRHGNSKKGMEMKMQRGFTVDILKVSLIVVCFGGWIANIVKLIGSNFDPLTGMVVARVIGIFMYPLGVVLGFL